MPSIRPLSLILLALAAPVVAGDTVRSVAVPGDGGWDYASVDASARRLYIAHGDAVSVVDLANGRALAPIGPAAHAHAVVLLPTGEIAVTNGTDNSVRFFAAQSGRQVASLTVGAKPDAAVVDPATGHLLSMDADAGSVAEIDVRAHRLVRTIPVAKGLEYAAVEGRTLFVNNEDRNELDVVDLTRGTAGAPIAMPGCEAPTGLGLDAVHHRLVAACANGVAAIVDTAKRLLVGRVPIGRGPDAVIVDRDRGRAYIPAGRDGVLDILSLADARTVTHQATIRTEPSARTGALDPRTGTVWLPAAQLAPAVGGGKPRVVPGSFHVLAVHPG
ncbi:hypothetical protein [Sphingomonas sp. GV3]|uniref:YncE family protein n=1 Tax=Sphingomonas sp. GV3 TaxID=3040671 RepID=UPI00280B0805|nr:hypothetical protein [Sphingomonas sp. GV3]